MDKHETKHFVMTLVAAFISTNRYMQRNYMPAKSVKKTSPPP
ncbi:hypothetical protein [Candidatus Sodalis endolongispinus]|nr:hypothetical protein [Candidatus Sodalis endolongispinus]